MVKVINKYDTQKVQIGSVVINVMRGTPLGNPFNPLKFSKQDRMTVLKRYRIWLWGKIKANDAEVMKAIFEIGQYHLQGKTVLLECCCAPRGCHADIILAAIKWLYKINAYKNSSKFGALEDCYTLTLDETNDDYL